MLLLVAALGGVSFWGVAQLAHSITDMADGVVPRVSLAQTLRGDILNTRVSILSHLAADNADDRTTQRQLFEERSMIVDQDLEHYAAIASSAEETRLIAELKASWQAYVGQVPIILEMSDAGQKEQAYEQNNSQLRPLALANAAAAQQLADYNSASSIASAKAASDLAHLIEAILIAGVLGVVIVTLVFATVIIRAITRGIDAIIVAMRKLADGDLTVEVPMRGSRSELGMIADALEVFKLNMVQTRSLENEKVVAQRRTDAASVMMARLQAEISNVVDAGVSGDFTRRIVSEFDDADMARLATGVNQLIGTVEGGLDETSKVLAAIASADLTERVHGSYAGAFGQLKSDTNAVADRLSEIMTQLSATSRSLKTATSEILSGSNDLSERTTKQAAAIEETSAAIEQISSTVKTNARQAEEATLQTAAAAALANAGGKVMDNATDAMHRITASSVRISNIIEMIDDIAFQTNLLALNASVEAARAGDAGKGFAVVAVEVRRLAQNAANASAEIKELIEQSSAEVDDGAKLVAEASTNLARILDAVQQNSVLMNSISMASQEQASAIQQVSAAVRQMDEMTQHNAALVDETNAAIEQTESQASDLDNIVRVFVLIDPHARSAKTTLAPRNGGNVKDLQARVATAARSFVA